MQIIKNLKYELLCYMINIITYILLILKMSLIKAVSENDLNLVIQLLEYGLPESYNLNDLLIDASKYGHIEIVKLLLEKGANINHKNCKNYTALIQASYNGHIEIVKLLLEKGANISEKTHYASTEIIFASVMGHHEIVKILLNVGVSQFDKTNYVNTFRDSCYNDALNLAIEKGHIQDNKLILEVNSFWMPKKSCI
jgi:ankyrin repeat protein